MKIIKYIAPLTFVLLGFLIYSNVLYAPFIFDDEWYIKTNYQIRDISNFLKDFSGTRYIGFLSFALNYYFNGLDTFWYHIVNIVIHILNAMLVYAFVILTFKAMEINVRVQIWHLDFASTIAFVVSLVFLVHPIQTQAVSYISQRFTSLAALFYFLALVLYVKARINKMLNFMLKFEIKHLTLYFLSILSTILAMKTKEISFTLPFIILLYEFTFFNSQHKTINSRVLYLLPFLLTIIIIPLTLFLPVSNTNFGESIRQHQIQEFTTLSKYQYLLTQFRVIVTYIRLLIFPVNQHFVYVYPLSNSIFEPKTFLPLVFLLTIFSFAVYLWLYSRKTHNVHGLLISFGIFWFFITLSVESSIIPIRDVIFEHRLYLPSVGFIIFVTATIFYLSIFSKKTGSILFRYLLIIIILITLTFIILTYKRNLIWQDELKLWLDEANKTPNWASIHNNLGVVYYKRRMLDKAIDEYMIALKLNPNDANIHNNLGVVYSKQERYDKAIEEFSIALELNPNFTMARNNLWLAQNRIRGW